MLLCNHSTLLIWKEVRSEKKLREAKISLKWSSVVWSVHYGTKDAPVFAEVPRRTPQKAASGQKGAVPAAQPNYKTAMAACKGAYNSRRAPHHKELYSITSLPSFATIACNHTRITGASQILSEYPNSSVRSKLQSTAVLASHNRFESYESAALCCHTSRPEHTTCRITSLEVSNER